jgi:hypothetical protein
MTAGAQVAWELAYFVWVEEPGPPLALRDSDSGTLIFAFRHRRFGHCLLTLLAILALWIWIAVLTYRLPEERPFPAFSTENIMRFPEDIIEYSTIREVPETVLSRIFDSSHSLFWRFLFKVGWRPQRHKVTFEVIDLREPKTAILEAREGKAHRRYPPDY